MTFFLLSLLFIGSPASAAPLTWGADAANGAPYILRDPSHPDKIVGFEVDLANALAQELGMTPEFVQNQWDGLIPGLKRGNYDVVINGIEITEDRRAEIDFSDPYYLADEVLTVRKDEYGINALADLKGRKAGTLKGALAERILRAQPGVRVLGYENQTTLYDDLANGRIDAVLLDEPAAIYYGQIDRRLKNVVGRFGELSYGVCARKGHEVLLNKINVALRALIRAGKLRRIYERWGIWNAVMEARFKEDPASARSHEEPVELRAYMAARQLQRGWRAQAAQYASYLPLLARGAVITIGLSSLAMVFAVLLGLAVALLRLYAPAPFPAIGLAYVEFVRGTPLLIQLFFIYYGLPNVGIRLEPFTAAVLGLALNYGAYEAEVYRAGILAVPHSQMEAALALDLTRWQALRHVVIPQALRLVIPPMTNDFISLLKDSSLVSVITMVELTRVYGQLAATYYDYFGIGLLTAAAYFVIGLPFVRLSRWAETRLAFDRRSAAPKPAVEA